MLKYFAFQKCVGYIKWWYILSIKLCNGLISVELCLHLFLSEVERHFFFSPICVMLIRYQGQKANRSVVSADFLKRGVVEERHYILLHEKILEDTNGCSSSVTWDVFTLVSKGHYALGLRFIRNITANYYYIEGLKRKYLIWLLHSNTKILNESQFLEDILLNKLWCVFKFIIFLLTFQIQQ